MKPMTSAFGIEFDPVANPAAVVHSAQVRFTVLTERMLRLEYSPDNSFEDRPSQTFWKRNLPVPNFERRHEEGRIMIETAFLLLEYKSGCVFSADSLQITLKDNGTTWHYGDQDSLNLLGTARTLDNVDGALVLEEGLLSRNGWMVYDDTLRLVFNEDGWLEPRRAQEGYQDLMFFGYGLDYQGCLHDFCLTASPAPLIPRWVLGNWWSRYWAYSAEELLGVMDEFAEHQVPLSVCIVDMDWHLVETGNASSGWTGYTWNRELFPDPPAFLAALHKRGLKTALNLHPAQGIHDHEAQYEAMCARLGVDPASKTPIPFDIANPQFARAYFELLHYPQEADGVDFWWLDWQQGQDSSLSGLDPLSWLNHLHFYDLGRDGLKRPFIFSRWGGLGNHRTPIGFSGDTVITWESLAFQPYFTATAANVNYGWWSHDIGGHMGGYEEPQLYTRWVQFGVFSPILRLHSTSNPFHERRPWGWDAETERVTSAALRLRHQLIPYIYSMAWRNHTRDLPLIRPMYHDYAQDEQAYHCPDQYTFGSELLAAPFLERLDEQTGLSRQVVWLPPGDWYGFFDGLAYPGNGWHALYGTLDDIPVFARAGAIVPMAPAGGWAGVENPDLLEIHLFPGADNAFALYEDDGLESFSITPLVQNYSGQNWQFTIGPVEGETGHLPAARAYRLIFHALEKDAPVLATRNGEALAVKGDYDQDENCVCVFIADVLNEDHIRVSVPVNQVTAVDSRLDRCHKLVHAARIGSWVKYALDRTLPQIVADPSLLEKYELQLTRSQLRAFLEIINGAGFQQHKLPAGHGEEIILWNNWGEQAGHFKLAALDVNSQAQVVKGVLPKFAVLTCVEKSMTWHEGQQPAFGRANIESWLFALTERIESWLDVGTDLALGFEVNGKNGRQFTLTVQDGRAALHDGSIEPLDAAIGAAEEDWLALINGETTPQDLFVQGKVELSGNFELLLRISESLKIVPPGKYQRDQWRLTIDYMDLLHWQLP